MERTLAGAESGDAAIHTARDAESDELSDAVQHFGDIIVVDGDAVFRGSRGQLRFRPQERRYQGRSGPITFLPRISQNSLAGVLGFRTQISQYELVLAFLQAVDSFGRGSGRIDVVTSGSEQRAECQAGS